MKYFKIDYAYFMVSGDIIIMVKSYDHLGFYQIEIMPNVDYHFIGKKTPISETEFKNEFLRVSILIEETINN